MKIGRPVEDAELVKEQLRRNADLRSVYERAFHRSANGTIRTAGHGGHYVMVECPIHDDSSPSMALYYDAPSPFFKCFTGCGSGDVFALLMQGRVANDFRDAVTWLRDSGLAGHLYTNSVATAIRQDSSGGSGTKKKQSKLVKVLRTLRFDYFDEHGKRVAVTVRPEGLDAEGKETKDFFQCHYSHTDESGECTICRERDYHDQNGKTDYRAHDKPRIGLGNAAKYPRSILFIDEVLKGAAEGKAIFWVEGEKKCQALRALGVVATTNQCGSSTPMEDRWAELVRGTRCLYILADCDEPGRKGALMREHFFRQRGIPTVYIDIAPDRWDSFDIGDWCEEHTHLTIEQRRSLLRFVVNEAAERWTSLDTIVRVTSDESEMDAECLILPMTKEGVSRALATPSRLIQVGNGEREWSRKLVREAFKRGTPLSFSSNNPFAQTYYQQLVAKPSEPAPPETVISPVTAPEALTA